MSIPGKDSIGHSVPGQISVGLAANALGALLTATVSTIAGNATGGASVSGVVLTTTTSIVSGVVDISQNGVIIAVQAALIDGSATGGAVAGGSIVTAVTALLEGVATSSAIQAGVVFDVVTSIEQGAAIGGAEVSGHLLTFTVSLTDGAVFGGAAGDAGAPGSDVEVGISITAGIASATAAPPIEQRFGGGNTFVSAPPRIDGVARGWLFVVHCDVVSGVGSGVRIAAAPRVAVVVPTPSQVKPPRDPVLSFVNVEEIGVDVTGNLMSLAVLIEPGVAGTTWSENDRNNFIAMVA